MLPSTTRKQRNHHTMSTTILRDEEAQQQQFCQLLQRPVRDLAAALTEETHNYRAHQPHDDLAGLALFTLAIVQDNQEAWTALYTLYRPLVISWVMQHSQARFVADDGDVTSLIDGAFVKFFQAVTPEKLRNFHSLGALLRYLRLCAQSVVS